MIEIHDAECDGVACRQRRDYVEDPRLQEITWDVPFLRELGLYEVRDLDLIIAVERMHDALALYASKQHWSYGIWSGPSTETGPAEYGLGRPDSSDHDWNYPSIRRAIEKIREERA